MRIIVSIIFCMCCSFGFAQTQFEMNMEAAASYRKADKELNLVYNQIVEEYQTDTLFINCLRKSQRLWIKFRDAELRVRFPHTEHRYYGSVYPLCKYGLLEELTRYRTKTLRAWIDGERCDICNGSVKGKY
ncbi:MAG: DUF1311 domain-containing protein [Prolixibacteraceae bacterium]|nr:DUF1311 domain-containing protein [Prolixibacteraceae bacterium]